MSELTPSTVNPDLRKIGWQVHRGDPIHDGDWCLLCRDPQTGDTIWFNDKVVPMVYRYQQDVEPTLIMNKAIKDGTEGRRFGDYNLIGSVPDHIAEASGLNEAWRHKDKKFFNRFFNDGDLAAFKGTRGRVALREGSK
jgi:hypothetical protein